jgi:hypothetical protein
MKRLLGVLLLIGIGWLAMLGTAKASFPPGSWMHPLRPTRPEMMAQCLTLPAEARNHVHIIIMNGIDPGNLCNGWALYDYARSLGYCNVYYGQMWDRWRYENKIRAIRCSDPDARIVLLGYSAGTFIVRSMANSLQTDGTRIDLLIYLGSDLIYNSPRNHPANVCRAVNIRGWGVVFLAGGCIRGTELNGCENYNVGVVRHACLPTNQGVLEHLTHELAVVTASYGVNSQSATSELASPAR